MRKGDRVQLILVATGFVYFVVAVGMTVASGQTQDAINATLFERMAANSQRLDRVENYLTAMLLAVLSSLAAHLVSILTTSRHRERRRSTRDNDDE